MKARGKNAPEGRYSIEPIPKMPGICLVRFYENVQPFHEERGESAIEGFEWDEYHLEKPDNGALEDMVEANYDHYLMLAKAQETPVPSQLDRVEAQTMFTALMTDTLLEEEE